MALRIVLTIFVMFGGAWIARSQPQPIPATPVAPAARPEVEFARIVRYDKEKSFVVLGVQQSKSEKVQFKKDDKVVSSTSFVIYQDPWKIDLANAAVFLSLEGGSEPFCRELKRVEGDDLWKRLAPNTTIAMINTDPAKFELNSLRVVQGNLLIFVVGKKELSNDDLPQGVGVAPAAP